MSKLEERLEKLEKRLRRIEAYVHDLNRKHLGPCHHCGECDLREPWQDGGVGSLWYGCKGCNIARYEETLYNE